jgi:hypothetical protein
MRDSGKEKEPAGQPEKQPAGQLDGASDKEPYSEGYDILCYGVY